MTDSPPRLQVETRIVDDPGPLVAMLSPQNPLAFLRAGDGVIGIGEALRMEFSGVERLRDAAVAWRSVADGATVADPLEVPGSGLIAFGSFAFSPVSPVPSALVVPATVIGRRNGVAWITACRVADSQTAGSPVSDSQAEGSQIGGSQAGGDAEPLGSAVAASFVPGWMSESGYLEAVRGALKRISAGEVRKIVLARDLVAAIEPGADLRVPIARLADSYPDTFTFAVDGLIGSSPETLVRAERGTVSARVLAGSTARGADAMSDASAAATLAASRKDVAEHAFAIASVLAALRPRTSALSASVHPFALRLPNLWHLASDVTGALADGSSALDLVAALHPTAAVGGEPTDVALEAIADLESFDRGRYAGPVGWVDGNGDGEWAIALRCAQVSGAEVRAYAGAGIVRGSDPRRELAETALKFRPIVEAFGNRVAP